MIYNNDLNPSTQDAYELMHNGILALNEMSSQGLRVNLKYIRKKKIELTTNIESISEEFKSTKFFAHWDRTKKGKVNIFSPEQLGIYLYKVKKIEPPKFTDSGQGSTDEEALGQLKIPELQLLLKAKKLKKMRDTYLGAFEREQVNGFMHPNLILHLVRSYRSSCNNPNLQNIPKRDEELMKIVRRAIYPRKGHELLELDYGQLEVRIGCAYHKDRTMMNYVETGHDFHLDYCKEIFKIKKYDPKITGYKMLRGATKNGFVFPQFYGDWFKPCAANIAAGWGDLPKKGTWKPGMGIPVGDANLADHFIKRGIKTLGKFEKHIEKIEQVFWGETFQGYAKWKDKMYAQYVKDGYFTSLTGFTYQGNMSKNDANNYGTQGSAFHVLLWSIIEGVKAQKGGKWRTRLVMETHDSILLDVYPPERDEIIKIMKCIMTEDTRRHFGWINVPLSIDAELCGVNKSWASKKDYKIN